MKLRLSIVCCAVLALHCGGSPSRPSSADATITITSSGVSPSDVRIKTFGHVRFVNQDIRPHAISSDPVQTHSDCPAINNVGLLNPGESRETGALNLARTCGFHDHNDEFNSSLKGRIVVE